VASQEETALDPLRFVPELFRDRGDRELRFIHERGDHARLVHGADGFRRGVGPEQARLHGGDIVHRFDDDGDFGASFLSPAGEPFEAVENLVGAVGGGGDPKRHGRQLIGLGVLAAQRGQRRLELIHVHVKDVRHG
jgi:hypothetical protein